MGLLDTLNKEQRQAASTVDGPLLVIAGAGSGKTRVLTHRIAYLIEEIGIKPWNILAITFTNKAAGEMRERVDKLVGFGADQIWVSTFHSACVRILRRHIDRLGYDNSFTIYDSDDQKTVMKGVIKHLNLDPKTYKERAMLSAVSAAKNELISVSQYETDAAGDYDYMKKIYAKAYREYQETLEANNALDFDDIIVKTVELFKCCPEVLESYQDRFQYIMVDEYQDTNTAQFELVGALAKKYRNLCVVGDDDQSIYKFRGANIRNILDFEEHFPEAVTIKLEQNYRSTQPILDAANAVISNNAGRKAKTLWTGRGDGEKVRLRQFDTAYEEAEFIAGDVARKVGKQGAKYRDCAVLYRTNAQARLVEERMIMEGMPYNVVGGTNFYSRMEIKDILAYLKTIESGRDEVAVRRILNVPRRGIGNATLEKLEDYARMRGIGLYAAMEQADEIMSLGKAAAKIRPFVQLIQSLRRERDQRTIAELIRFTVDKIGYEEYLADYDDEGGEDRLANVGELITKAVNYTETHEEPTLTEFLEEVALVADIDNVDGEDDRVLLMTLHSAKGLEFPYVYLAGMEDGLFPGYQTINSDDPTDLEEERRLAYVGITRAMDELTLTCAKMRMIRGETQYNPVSRFVGEIPDELLDSNGSASRRWTMSGEAKPDAFVIPNEGAFMERSNSNPQAPFGRPKAIIRPRTTPKADKPYIAKGIGSLNQLAGISKGTPHQAPEALTYGVGDRVSHIKYGQGSVLKIDREPRDYKVTVEFDSAGQKIMYASFAKLKRL
ncbi:MAG: UvrD-helicase domain-containing protein [Lachnospiraceae bacterium]|uniref:ATP-dependent helicase n=1 Tax=uncultured Faecalibaculum sp. TaxID=1729681 RepID=UPI002602FE79|nr:MULTISPECIES: UvrD-helicase domain-containing protein [Bacillota]MCI9219406.1 UvrD-helicase domain-containing protein [Lachnospiraceae bacterium]